MWRFRPDEGGNSPARANQRTAQPLRPIWGRVPEVKAEEPGPPASPGRARPARLPSAERPPGGSGSDNGTPRCGGRGAGPTPADADPTRMPARRAAGQGRACRPESEGGPGARGRVAPTPGVRPPTAARSLGSLGAARPTGPGGRRRAARRGPSAPERSAAAPFIPGDPPARTAERGGRRARASGGGGCPQGGGRPRLEEGDPGPLPTAPPLPPREESVRAAKARGGGRAGERRPRRPPPPPPAPGRGANTRGAPTQSAPPPPAADAGPGRPPRRAPPAPRSAGRPSPAAAPPQPGAPPPLPATRLPSPASGSGPRLPCPRAPPRLPAPLPGPAWPPPAQASCRLRPRTRLRCADPEVGGGRSAGRPPGGTERRPAARRTPAPAPAPRGTLRACAQESGASCVSRPSRRVSGKFHLLFDPTARRTTAQRKRYAPWGGTSSPQDAQPPPPWWPHSAAAPPAASHKGRPGLGKRTACCPRPSPQPDPRRHHAALRAKPASLLAWPT
ncbi:proline-rich protein 2-like [Hippopotamus amphibius kiboko]|uniref:proline-rich protein 2-like n=1 Tax=Hippopotamus amphibius kiboko TaxID=575201 RepID=UPI002591D3DD|nr:proline-rich protein 2-like [Hippopotamus amphibius kiboko]